METAYTLLVFVVLFGAIAVPYWRRVARHKREAVEKFEKNQRMGILPPVTMHPHFDLTNCIGCANCVRACPEHVLGIVQGRPAIINGTKCVGHGLCADVCPVGAITLGFGTPRQGMELPQYDHNFETNVRGLYIIGELSGMGLIKNAIAHGKKAVQHVASNGRSKHLDGLDIVIVGAGPAGLSAALSAQALNLRYVLLEQDEIGGALLHYPRQKLVLTSPVELPLYGKLKVSEIKKEELLRIWKEVVGRFHLNVVTGQKVEVIHNINDRFIVKTQTAEFTGANVMLALGRRGSPRKLGVTGENLSKVMYRLIEAESYKHKHILVVGGGDSAVEAAIGLASQTGNVVTISYRKEDFVRLKEKNEQKVRQYLDSGTLHTMFNSQVLEIREDTVLVQESGKIMHNLKNDFVFIFAGGELPTELLKKCGIKLRPAEVEAQAVAA
ncbi:MAG: NAD(P)-binding domain-containing protein [Bacteroidetes bacterium]|nr:NAD(P)-binding domain-containing protein [Bacteroidota bacterium]MCW5896892.1 NAD(P)-binding domain-containing protein [Bacteroidota bacterium]